MSRTSLLWKLALAFLLVAIVATGLVAFFIRLTSTERLVDLILDQQRVNLQSQLENYYLENGSWAGIEEDWFQIQFQPRITQIVVAGKGTGFDENPKAFPIPPGARDRRSLFGLADSSGRVIVATNPKLPVGAIAPNAELKAGAAVTVDGQRVGTILVERIPPQFNAEEALYLRRTDTALAYAAGAAMLVALVIGMILARTLIMPLQALTRAAQHIADGQLEQQVKVTSTDEIGRLAEAFNRMSQEVSRVNLQRKQMTADIAHDLRTPLTVIAGYVESMRDGVLKPTPERLALIYEEIERLQDLVGDLKMLSQMDAGEMPLHPQPIAPRTLLEHAAAPFQHRAAQQSVSLAVEAGEDLPMLHVDESRMMQVFGNLLTNSLRYTPEGGAIRLQASASPEGGTVILRVQDNGSGVPEEDLPYIFDRFHRADKSRHTVEGESGLGLAIVKALVEAHGGKVRALPAEGGGSAESGLVIEMTLPG